MSPFPKRRNFSVFQFANDNIKTTDELKNSTNEFVAAFTSRNANKAGGPRNTKTKLEQSAYITIIGDFKLNNLQITLDCANF